MQNFKLNKYILFVLFVPAMNNMNEMNIFQSIRRKKNNDK